MSDDALEAVIQGIMDGARADLQKDGQLRHTLIAVTTVGDVALMTLDGLHPEIWPQIARVLEDETPDWQFILRVSESWVALKQPGEQIEQPPPRKNPNRIEAIVVEGKTRDHVTYALVQPIGRDDAGKPTFERSAYWFRSEYSSRVLSTDDQRGKRDEGMHH